MNWLILIIVGILAVALIVFLIVKNQKDERQLENQLNNDYKKCTSEENGTDLIQ